MLKRLLLILIISLPVLAFAVARIRYGSSTAEKFCRRSGNAFLALTALSVPVCVFLVHVITSSEPGITFTQALTRVWLFWAIPLGGFIIMRLGEFLLRSGRL